MNSFQQYMNEQFVGKDPSRSNVGRDIFKALKEKYKEKLGYIPLKPMALIEVREQDSPVLKAIGFSEPDDLLLDIFGAMFSGCINTGADVLRNITDNTGVVRTVRFQENGNAPNAFATGDGTPAPNLSMGGFFKLGSGVTPPTRADFQIETSLIAAPFSGNVSIITPVWISANQEGIVTGILSNALIAETIFECGMFCNWRQDSSTSGRSFMVSHDATNVPYQINDHVQVTYTWSLS